MLVILRVLGESNMLIVKTYLGKSNIEGLGLFAAERIPKGKIVWILTPGFDVILTKKEIDKLPNVVKSFIIHYGYHSENEGGWVICGDNARFINHSDNPNLAEEDYKPSIAQRTIEKDEEIVCNYFLFDLSAKAKLKKTSKNGRKFNGSNNK
jgi:hypothetical protein